MAEQITREIFEHALSELGHDPNEYKGKRLTLNQMGKIYDLEQDLIMEAIDQDLVAIHYDYQKDVIWVDALDAAHFYYCLKSNVALYTDHVLK